MKQLQQANFITAKLRPRMQECSLLPDFPVLGVEPCPSHQRPICHGQSKQLPADVMLRAVPCLRRSAYGLRQWGWGCWLGVGRCHGP